MPIAVRVQATAADLQHGTVQALRGHSSPADLPGYRSGVVEGVVEAAREDMQASIGGAGIGGT